MALSKVEPYRVLMVTGVYPTQETPYLGTFIKTQVESLKEAGLQVEVIHPMPGRPVPVRYFSAALQVFFKTLTGRFDIVHGHYGLWCLVARLQWMTPVIASFLGSDILRRASFDSRFTRKDELVISLSRWLSRHVDAVNVKSNEMKKALAGGNVFVYPDGIDFDLFRPIPRAEARASFGWEQDRYYILFGNNPKRVEKDFPLAQAAIERLLARGITAELVVVHGLPQSQVVQYINASNAVILSSLYEGSPNIVKEAMACNVPIVATDVGDVSQVIDHTKGCKVCTRNADDLALGLEEALLHSEPTTGRNDISHLERSVITQQIIMIYDQVIGSHKRIRGHTFKNSTKVSAQNEEVI